MILTIVNGLLIFAISMTLILIGMLIRQNVKLPIALVYVIILFFFSVDIFSIAYTLNSGATVSNQLAGKIHLFAGSILLGILHYFAASFTYAKNLPRLKASTIVVTGSALLIGILPFFGFFIDGLQSSAGIYFTLYTGDYWLFIFFGAVVCSLIFYEIYTRYQRSAHRTDLPYIREVLWVVFPLMFAALFFIYVIPYFRPPLPAFYIGYAFIAALLFFSAVRFQILENTELNQYLFPQIMVSGFFLVVFYLSVERTTGISALFWGIAFFLMCTFLGYYTLQIFMRSFKKVQIGYDERLDQKLEEFSTKVVTCIEAQQLWNYLGEFCKTTFDFSKIAVVTSPVNMPPYQIEYINGYEAMDIQAMLGKMEKDILQRISRDSQLVNRFDISNNEELYDALDQLDVYLGIPLRVQHDVSGFIFLGGERKYIPIPRRHIHFFKIIGTQTAVAVENIRNIEQMMQAQKMAGLGLLASQVAHDFRSFIALTKNQNRENPRLGRQATYMDKMVQDLLDYARPQDLKLSDVQLNQLLDMTLDLVRVPETIAVERSYQDGLPSLKLDISQMRRVFTNIIENAIRSMTDGAGLTGSSLHLSTRTLPNNNGHQRGSWVQITIEDQGLGIDEEFIERIFDPFFTTYKHEGGNGLGLAIVKQIIDRHSGMIDVFSKVGQGTRFRVQFPNHPM